MELLMNFLLILFFILGCIQDIKRKEISVILLVLLLPIFLLQIVIGTQVAFIYRCLGSSIGAVFYLISRVTREQIGKGDAYIIIGLGFLLGSTKLLNLLCYCFCFAMLTAIILLTFQHAKRKREIAFFPFLFLGYLCVLFFEGNAI